MVQSRFLCEISINEQQALADWNLAPLPCRRAIAMLGLLYRIAMEQAPQPLCELFRRDHSVRTGHTNTRGSGRRHPLQLCEALTMVCHTDVARRSLFGLVTVWNMVSTAFSEASRTHCGEEPARLTISTPSSSKPCGCRSGTSRPTSRGAEGKRTLARSIFVLFRSV